MGQHGVAARQVVRGRATALEVAAANVLLARGERAFGAEIAAAAHHLPQAKAKIGPFLEKALGSSKGAAMIDRALAKLKAAGYRVQ